MAFWKHWTGFLQATYEPMSLVWIDGDRPLPVLLTDRWGRGHPRQRHGGVFVRVCRTGRCGECVIEVPQLRIVPPFSGLERTGAEQQPSQVMRCIRRYHPAPPWTVSVCGWAFHWWWCHSPFICPRFSACGGCDGARQQDIIFVFEVPVLSDAFTVCGCNSKHRWHVIGRDEVTWDHACRIKNVCIFTVLLSLCVWLSWREATYCNRPTEGQQQACSASGYQPLWIFFFIYLFFQDKRRRDGLYGNVG